MQTPPTTFQCRCKAGILHLEDANVFVSRGKTLLWSIPIQTIVRIHQTKQTFSVDIALYTMEGKHVVEMLSKKNADQFMTFFANHQPPHVQIDQEMERIKFAIEKRRLRLREVHMNMANTRAHYQQAHMGGWVGEMQRSNRNIQLSKQQPIKEQLEREKLQLEQRLQELKLLKKQGMQMVIPFAEVL